MQPFVTNKEIKTKSLSPRLALVICLPACHQISRAWYRFFVFSRALGIGYIFSHAQQRLVRFRVFPSLVQVALYNYVFPRSTYVLPYF